MASYNNANMKQIGKNGDWRSLGLPSLRDIEYDVPMTKTKIADAWHSNAFQYDYWRKGTLLYLRA